jgi:hypothetical protein
MNIPDSLVSQLLDLLNHIQNRSEIVRLPPCHEDVYQCVHTISRIKKLRRELQDVFTRTISDATH